MSTRSQIGFYDTDEQPLEKPSTIVYRHCDGYPDTEHGVVATVLPIIKEFIEGRGFWDIEYLPAWVVAKLKEDFLNIGICGRDHDLHGDIEYYYAVRPASFTVYSAGYSSDFGKLKKLKAHKLEAKNPHL